MKLCIPLFGILAAVLGVAGSLVALGLQLHAFATGSIRQIDTVIFVALALSVLGLYGARLAIRYPRLSATVMATAALGGLLSVAWFYAISAVVFALASGLGFLWRNEAPPGLKGG